MNCELHSKIPANRLSDLKERRKRFRVIFRNMRRISAAGLDQFRQPQPLTQDLEPIQLGQRVVFRSLGQVPVKRLVELHRLIKCESNAASHALTNLTNSEPTSILNRGLHCAVRHIFEE